MTSDIIFTEKDLAAFVEQAKEQRKKLRGSREKFWESNKKNFEQNLKTVFLKAHIPDKWKVHIIASHILNNDDRMPFDYDSWSTLIVVASTIKQGFEQLLFINQSRAGFLSLPALVPLLTHELTHSHQAAQNPQAYHNGAFNDENIRETQADEAVLKLPELLVQQAVLESVLYCYDQKGWSGADQMIKFYHNKKDIYKGGYLSWVSDEIYQLFWMRKSKTTFHFS